LDGDLYLITRKSGNLELIYTIKRTKFTRFQIMIYVKKKIKYKRKEIEKRNF
jgi:hypothetical protein